LDHNTPTMLSRDIPRTLWVDPVVLTWKRLLTGSYGGDPDAMRRPYEHWEHAAAILDERHGHRDRMGAIATLKRAIDHRPRALKQEYKLRPIPLRSAPKGDLQRLEHLGIARHTMVLRLLEIRNRVEHGDVDPPAVAVCRDLLELT